MTIKEVLKEGIRLSDIGEISLKPDATKLDVINAVFIYYQQKERKKNETKKTNQSNIATYTD